MSIMHAGLILFAGLLMISCGESIKDLSNVSTQGLTSGGGDNSEVASASPTPLASPTPTPTPTPLPSSLSQDSTNSFEYPLRTNDGSQIYVFKDEGEMLNARLKLLDGAKKEVYIQSYIFYGDYSGNKIAEKLVNLKKKGVDVKVIVDHQANLAPTAQAMYAKMFIEGLPVIGFQPLYMGIVQALAGYDKFEDYFNHVNNRYHEKLFLVDPTDLENGRGIIGGANLSDDYFAIEKNEKTGGFWVDKDVLLRGPILADLAASFKESYAYHSGRNRDPNPTVARVAAFLKDLLVKEKNVSSDVKANFKKHTDKPFEPVFEDASLRFLHSDPQKDEFDIYISYLDFINSAQTSIQIANAYFIPNDEQKTALLNAAKRGVKVEILTNSIETIDFPVISHASRMLYRELIKDDSLPLRVYEWGKPGKRGFSLYHSKFITVDNQAAIVGSFNFDPRSHRLNNETAVLIGGVAAVKTLVEQFERDIAPELSTRVKKEDADLFQNKDGLNNKLVNFLIETFLPVL